MSAFSNLEWRGCGRDITKIKISYMWAPLKIQFCHEKHKLLRVLWVRFWSTAIKATPVGQFCVGIPRSRSNGSDQRVGQSGLIG